MTTDVTLTTADLSADTPPAALAAWMVKQADAVDAANLTAEELTSVGSPIFDALYAMVDAETQRVVLNCFDSGLGPDSPPPVVELALAPEPVTKPTRKPAKKAAAKRPRKAPAKGKDA